jgi:hypothetical protein
MYYYSSTSCAFKKLEGGAATRTKRKPTYYSPAAEPLTATATTKTKLKMAPHMLIPNSNKNNDESLLQSSISYFKSNPLLFAIVIFPTLTMGILLVARPKLRPAFLGGPGTAGNVTRGDNRNDDNVVQSSPMVSSSLVSPGNEQAYYAEAVIATVGAASNDNINIDDRRSSSSSDEVMVKMEEEVKEVTETKNIIGRWREKISLRKRYLLDDDGSIATITTTDEKKEEGS